MSGLHVDEQFSRHAERRLQLERHPDGQGAMAVQQVVEAGTCDAKGFSRSRDVEAERGKDIVPDEFAGMGGGFHLRGHRPTLSPVAQAQQAVACGLPDPRLTPFFDLGTDARVWPVASH